jgi:DNA-binding NarL/FixJ family response regulator
MERRNMKSDTSALLAVRPGPLRDALRALMSTIPQIESVQEAWDSPSMLDMVIRYQPALVLLEAALPGGGGGSVIERIRALRPQVQCLVLADTCQEKKAARAAHADAVLPKGLPPARLVEAIERSLVGRGW